MPIRALANALVKKATAILVNGSRQAFRQPVPCVVYADDGTNFIGDLIPVIPGATNLRIPKNAVMDPDEEERKEIEKKIQSSESM